MDFAQGLAFATDGHVGAWIPVSKSDRESIFIPSVVAKDLLKLKYESEITDNSVVGSLGSIKLKTNINVPNISQIITGARSASITFGDEAAIFGINPYLLLKVAKALGCTGKKQHTGIKIEVRSNSSAVIVTKLGENEPRGLVMPMRV